MVNGIVWVLCVWFVVATPVTVRHIIRCRRRRERIIAGHARMLRRRDQDDGSER